MGCKDHDPVLNEKIRLKHETTEQENAFWWLNSGKPAKKKGWVGWRGFGYLECELGLGVCIVRGRPRRLGK